MDVTGKLESGTELLQVEGPKAEGPYTTAKVSVWWDIENFGVGKMSDPHLMVGYIHSSLVKMGYSGPISIFAYGNRKLIDDSLYQALSSTGITFEDVPIGKSYTAIIPDIAFWAKDNAAPASLMFLSDQDLLCGQNHLKLMRYNILQAVLLDTTATLTDGGADAR